MRTSNPDVEGRRNNALDPLLAGGALLLACAFPMNPAHAEDKVTVTETSGDSYLLGGVFYMQPDSSRNVDYGYGVNYGYGSALSERNAWEVRLFGATLETGIAGFTDFYQYGVGLDFAHAFGQKGDSHFFALIGAGAVKDDVSPDKFDSINAQAHAGVGWRSKPWSGWGLRTRIEVLGAYDSFRSGTFDAIAGIALEIPTERTRTIEREHVVERVVEKQVVKEVVKEVPVAPQFVDSDGDGIPDAIDQCPNTIPGANVGPDGCVHDEQVVVLPNVEFAFARAELTPAGKEALQQVLKFLKDQQGIKLEVWGHTDDKGADIYNLHLSQKRAAAVVKFLVDNGVDAKRLNSAGFGKTRPVADNATDEGRARNRRVELHLHADTVERRH